VCPLSHQGISSSGSFGRWPHTPSACILFYFGLIDRAFRGCRWPTYSRPMSIRTHAHQVQRHEAQRLSLLNTARSADEETASAEGLELHKYNEWLSNKLPRFRMVQLPTHTLRVGCARVCTCGEGMVIPRVVCVHRTRRRIDSQSRGAFR
jgi:hypothetical protein